MSGLRIEVTVAIGIAVLVVTVITLTLLEDTGSSAAPLAAVATAVGPPPARPEPSLAETTAGEAEPGSRVAPRRQTPDSDNTDDVAEDEATIMAKLRELGSSDPPVSLRLAREGNERFPDSPDAPERVWFEARALVDMQRFDEARNVAEDMVERYPAAAWTADVQRHLLTHPFRLPPRSR